MPSPTTHTLVSPPGPVFDASFEAALAAVDPRTCPQVNVQPEEAAARVLAHLPALHQLRARASDDGRVQLLDADLAEARTAAEAVLQLATALDAVRAPDTAKATLATEALALRVRLLRWARPLGDEDLLPIGEWNAVQGTTAHAAIAHDVRLLASAFDAHWERVSRLVPFDRTVLARALDVANQLAVASESRRGPLHPAKVLQVRRDAALWLLQGAWSRIRRTLTYVFWDAPDDVARWAPPWKPAGNAGRRKAPALAADDPSATGPAGSMDAAAARGAAVNTVPTLAANVCAAIPDRGLTTSMATGESPLGESGA